MEQDTELHRALGRIEGKLDSLFKLEGRVSALEAGQAAHGAKLAYWGGALVVLGTIATFFRAKLERFFS